ncbi:hypothetical protein S40288_10471 [Stachybotrys chartarum IBT 40288]|nr:hypothetical protein S40288_10471 [Stachybotrys chartarum IBT 40288]
MPLLVKADVHTGEGEEPTGYCGRTAAFLIHEDSKTPRHGRHGWNRKEGGGWGLLSGFERGGGEEEKKKEGEGYVEALAFSEEAAYLNGIQVDVDRE